MVRVLGGVVAVMALVGCECAPAAGSDGGADGGQGLCATQVCSASDECHQAGACNEQTGACTNPTKADGTTCAAGVCRAGVCEGAFDGGGGDGGSTDAGARCTGVVCTALDSCHDVGTCSTETGQCSNPAKPTGTVCDDADLCTQSDQCQSGVCVGGAPKACTASQPCMSSACVPSTGQCAETQKPDTTTCDDGDLCSQSDACQGGACVGANPKNCVPVNQCHTSACVPATGQCVDQSLPNGTVCNDGDLCTQTDTCQGGACVGANQKTCGALNQCHDAGACDPATGACSTPLRPNGDACDDGDLCTLTDTCQTGACVGGNARVCTPSGQCKTSTCAPTTGQCVEAPKSNGSTCDDGDLCTQTDTCQAGACDGGNPKSCSAPDTCHTSVCAPTTGLCVDATKPNGASCNDGDLCTTSDTCDAGVCVPSGAKNCVPTNVCKTSSCTPSSGACVEVSRPDGLGCGSTDAGTCGGGQCNFPGCIGTLCWFTSSAGNQTFSSAASTCASSQQDGFSGWRLPTINELKGLIRSCSSSSCPVSTSCPMSTTPCFTSICNGCAGSGGPGTAGCYWDAQLGGNCGVLVWSSTALSESANFKWGVQFSTGTVGYAAFDNLAQTRCVRTR